MRSDMKKTLQLYIHIPFCVKKCEYCDFLSFSANDVSIGNDVIQSSYVQSLVEELDFYGQKYHDRLISTIFVGGGTPSFLDEKLMTQIFNAVYRNFEVAKDAEITIECNPGTVTDGKLRSYQNMGINRLSIGLQSANNEELKILGRIHTFEQFLQTYDKARNYGFSNINVDLMSSLPNQTAKTFEKSLKKVIGLQPEHISAYSLIIEEGTPFYEKYEKDVRKREDGLQTEFLPNEEEEYRTTKLTRELLQSEGYHWYEISNFAKKGKECRHNIGYWKRADYLGVGLGAASLIKNVRYTNTDDIFQYRKAPKQDFRGMVKETEVLERTAQMEEFMFLGLRMTEGVFREEFESNFGIEIDSIYGDALKRLQKEELLLQNEGRIYLTEQGIDVSNYVLSQFLFM